MHYEMHFDHDYTVQNGFLVIFMSILVAIINMMSYAYMYT